MGGARLNIPDINENLAANPVSDETGSQAAGVVADVPRLLICSEGIPHESQGASLVLFYHYIDRLRRDGYRILHLLLLAGDQWAEGAVRSYAAKMTGPAGFDVKSVRAERFFREGRLRHTLLPGPPAMVEAAARAFRPDLVLAFDLLAAWITAGIETRRLVWLGDLKFQSIFFHALYASRENPLNAIHVPSNWLGCQAWKRIYGAVLRKSDEVVVASESSVSALAQLGVASAYEPYPWPEHTDASPKRTLPDTPTFLFFGALGGLGSRSALHFLTRKVFPLLHRIWGKGGFRLLIAGRGDLPEWARRAIAGTPEITTLGFVEDLDRVLMGCHAVVVPIDVPVGNRSRILTAMAKRTLVIAHANAALGNPALRDGHTCYLATNAAEFVERMSRAVTDRTRAEAIIENAARCYMQQFGVEPASTRLAARIGALAAQPFGVAETAPSEKEIR